MREMRKSYPARQTRQSYFPSLPASKSFMKAVKGANPKSNTRGLYRTPPTSRAHSRQLPRNSLLTIPDNWLSRTRLAMLSPRNSFLRFFSYTLFDTPVLDLLGQFWRTSCWVLRCSWLQRSRKKENPGVVEGPLGT